MIRGLTIATCGLFMFLAACGPAPVEPLPPGAPPAAASPAPGEATEGGDVPADPGIRGLEEREPDVCGASAFQDLVGQPAEAAANLPTDKPVRVIPFGAIVTQEYIPNRINVRLDPEGIIARIDCG